MGKKNLRRTPEKIINRIRAFDQDDVVVACVKIIRLGDIAKYTHLGIKYENNALNLPAPAVPDTSAGKWSKANVEGYEKKRTDLPKVAQTRTIEVPNWGDWSNGSHEIEFTRMVYPIDFYSPKEVELSITLVRKVGDSHYVKFAIEQVINRRTKDFEHELFWNLNILQENVGAADVFISAATLADYAESITVDWQLFPPGTIDEVVSAIIKGKTKGPTSDEEAIIRERVSVMAELQPEAYITGTDSFLRYFGAKFGDDFVVFENTRYGNALYVMREDWQELSKRSRINLLKGSRDKFDRIVHNEGWENELKETVKKYRTG